LYGLQSPFTCTLHLKFVKVCFTCLLSPWTDQVTTQVQVLRSVQGKRNWTSPFRSLWKLSPASSKCIAYNISIKWPRRTNLVSITLVFLCLTLHMGCSSANFQMRLQICLDPTAQCTLWKGVGKNMTVNSHVRKLKPN
jgi:hypothetical protein